MCRFCEFERSQENNGRNGLERFPNSLYKYYAYNTMYNENRLRGELFFSSPIHFNDVFDAQHEIINNSGKIEYRVAIDRLKEIGFENPIDVLNSLHESDERKMEVRHKQIEHVGILCLTNSPLNLLMWAYYGNNEGYCIEYNISKLRESIETKLKDLNLNSERCQAKEVSYLQSLPSAPLFFEGQDYTKSLDKYFCKAKVWEHEKEYRIAISLGGDKSIQIDDIVKSITLGYNMSVDNKLSLVSKLVIDFPDIDIYFLRKLEGTDGFEKVLFEISDSEKENIAGFRMRIEECSNK